MKVYAAKRGDKRRKGSAMITVLALIGVVMITTLYLTTFAKNQSGLVKGTHDYLGAKALAEAGASEAYAILKANWNAKGNSANFPQRSLGGGTYQATVTTVNTNRAGISCTATYGSKTATVKIDVANVASNTSSSGSGSGTTPPTSPWAYSVLINGYLTMNGAGINYDYLQVNSYISVNGTMTWGSAGSNVHVSCSDSSQGFSGNGTITINGSLVAPKITINGTKTITTQVITNVPVVSFPTPDLTAYYTIAVANGQVYSNLMVNGSTNWGTIPGGIKWVNGTFTQNGTLTYSGCIIATGAIQFNGGFTQTRVGDLPAVVSRDSTVQVNGSHTVQGLVYSKSDTSWNGSGSLVGALLVGGNCSFNGAYGLLSYTYSYPGTAAGGGSLGGTGGGTPQVAITCWQM